VADALTERVGPEVLLEHADDGRPLLVGEHVEHALGVGGRHDLELDGSGGVERVGVERSGARQAEVGQRSHSGLKASVASISMKVANASLSQMPFHHFMVTRSPNHMWASSWAITSVTRCSSGW